MFTGIVQGLAHIISVEPHDEELFKQFQIKFPDDALEGLTKGASIALNGTCLTVVAYDIEQSVAFFDVIRESLERTNLNALRPGDALNYERAARIGDEIGGHLMSGHIHTKVKISRFEASEANCSIFFTVPVEYRDYLFTKGFVGLNGCSLTLGVVTNEEFCVHLIPETLEVTTFSELKAGDAVNLEIDNQTQSTVDTVKRYIDNTIKA